MAEENKPRTLLKIMNQTVRVGEFNIGDIICVEGINERVNNTSDGEITLVRRTESESFFEYSRKESESFLCKDQNNSNNVSRYNPGDEGYTDKFDFMEVVPI
jgi:hypothetical protein|tara:strand:- start:241 stop:546 length:306 start_codon:yes stop_codon:yes gene_type:complete